MDSEQQSEMPPNQAFRPVGQTQFAHSQYPYPPTSAAFQMDQDIAMDHFTAGVQHTAISDSMATTGDPANNAPAHNTAPGMAPPQAGLAQPYSPSQPRDSLDDNIDSGMSGGGSKRKRSKVSRACDECRRKKVRCDAAADDGSIKTCTNCQRSGAVCGYNRVPMKRGPSKGYIKELSERVQQVESQMAMSSTAALPGFRHSLDGSSVLYPDQVYSSDDGMSFKRTFSFSDPRSPFANPEYNRDRMPSLGGWAAASPQTSYPRGRERGSLAIAPDQTSPTNINPTSKPFWSRDFEGPPPAKRLRLDVSPKAPPTLNQEMLGSYYQVIHVTFPLLPDNADASIGIFEKATAPAQHAFCAAISFVSGASVSQPNGQVNGDVASNDSAMFKSRADLAEFVFGTTRELPDQRSNEDNLVYIWTHLLMAVDIENDLSRLRDRVFPKAVMIRQTVELCWQCIQLENKMPSDSGSGVDSYRANLARAWYGAGTLARLHALATGSGNPMPGPRNLSLPPPAEIFNDVSLFLSLSSICLSPCISMIQSKLSPAQDHQGQSIVNREVALGLLDNILSIAKPTANAQSVTEHVQYFFELLLSRYTDLFHPAEILQPTMKLAEAIRQSTTASAPHNSYNPFRMHIYALTTITLLEFTQDGVKDELGKAASSCLEKMKGALEQIAEREHVEHRNGKVGTSSGQEVANTEGHRSTHWADALLNMIEQQAKTNSTIAASHADNSGGSGGGGNTNGHSTNEHTVAVDFSLLLRYGYLNVLAESAGI